MKQKHVYGAGVVMKRADGQKLSSNSAAIGSPVFACKFHAERRRLLAVLNQTPSLC